MHGPDGILWLPAGSVALRDLPVQIKGAQTEEEGKPVGTSLSPFFASRPTRVCTLLEELKQSIEDETARDKDEVSRVGGGSATTAPSRAEELEELAETRIVTENTSGVATIPDALSQQSFMPLFTDVDLAHFTAIPLVRALPHELNTPVHAQLADGMAIAVQNCSESKEDIVAEAMSLISDMTERLEIEADVDAKLKTHQDEELAHVGPKNVDRAVDTETLITAVGSMSARSAHPKSEFATLAKELANAATPQAKMD